MSDLPQSIALHIGAHKTASSHLQHVLNKNRKLISHEGIMFCGPGYLRQPGRNLESMFDLSWSNGTTPRRNPHDQLRFLAKGHERLVFSEENFTGTLITPKGHAKLPLYKNGAERVAELVAKFAPVETNLFLGIRNPAAFMASTYSQALFGKAHVGPRTFLARNDWRLIDWAGYVAQLRAVPGVSQFYVWRQEDYAATQRLILRRMLRWIVGGKIKTVDDRIHEGLSIDAVRQTLKWRQEGRTGALAHAARDMYPVGPDHPAFQLYPPAVVEDATAVYDAQMAQISQMVGVTVLRPPAPSHKG